MYTDQPPMNTTAVMHNQMWSGWRIVAVAGSGVGHGGLGSFGFFLMALKTL